MALITARKRLPDARGTMSIRAGGQRVRPVLALAPGLTGSPRTGRRGWDSLGGPATASPRPRDITWRHEGGQSPARPE